MNRMTIGALVGSFAVLGGGGSALAASKDAGDRAARCEARLAKIAERRGTTPAELEARVKARASARIEAALAAGRITETQAARLKERIADAQACKAPAALKAKLAKGGMFRAAAKYLGLTPAELRQQLPGTSLGALAAKTPGKTVEGLEAAMLAPAKARLAKAVANQRITQARADQALERFETLVERVVAKTFPSR